MDTRAFQIVIEKEPEGEGYYAYVPALPGCFSNGRTIGEARQNIREAMELHLSALREQNQPIPQGGRVVQVEEMTVSLPADDRIEIKPARAGKISDVFGILKREGGPTLSIEAIDRIATRGWAKGP
jgi:predicted RNase H-like HicB family nuclease